MNSRLADAFVASKIHILLIHIEAGIRSFKKLMPEEINRIMIDHRWNQLLNPLETDLVSTLENIQIGQPIDEIYCDGKVAYKITKILE